MIGASGDGGRYWEDTRCLGRRCAPGGVSSALSGVTTAATARPTRERGQGSPREACRTGAALDRSRHTMSSQACRHHRAGIADHSSPQGWRIEHGRRALAHPTRCVARHPRNRGSDRRAWRAASRRSEGRPNELTSHSGGSSLSPRTSIPRPNRRSARRPRPGSFIRGELHQLDEDHKTIVDRIRARAKTLREHRLTADEE